MARNPGREKVFRFQQFSVRNESSAMKVGTDGVLLGAWAQGGERDPERVLDIGTGTGLIALMLAQRFPKAAIDAIDIDKTAVEEASYNFSQSPWSERLSCNLADFNGYANLERPVYDLIVCNPPFFDEPIKSPDSARATARHRDALPISSLLHNAQRLLTESGKICLIYPSSLSSEILMCAALEKLTASKITDVITREGKLPQRTLWNFKKSDGKDNCMKSALILHDTSGNPTEEYRQLVESFYLRVK